VPKTFAEICLEQAEKSEPFTVHFMKDSPYGPRAIVVQLDPRSKIPEGHVFTFNQIEFLRDSRASVHELSKRLIKACELLQNIIDTEECDYGDEENCTRCFAQQQVDELRAPIGGES